MNGKDNTVRIAIDGRSLVVRRGEYVLDAARREGIDIPSLCSVEGMAPYAACRLCIVQVTHRGRSRIATSCNCPVREGLKVFLNTEAVVRERKNVFEVLLAQAPGSAKLRDYASKYGVQGTGLKVQEGSCILCGLCVNVCGDVVGANALTFSGRGDRRAVGLPYGEEDLEACVGCGACSFLCPTDCIDMESRKLGQLRARWRKGAERTCRYTLMGLLPGAACDNDYECKDCVLDRRMFEAAGGKHPAFLIARDKARRTGHG